MGKNFNFCWHRLKMGATGDLQVDFVKKGAFREDPRKPAKTREVKKAQNTVIREDPQRPAKTRETHFEPVPRKIVVLPI